MANLIYTHTAQTPESFISDLRARTSGMSYAETQDKLYLTAQLLDCDRLCVCCYRHLLDYIFSYPRLDSTNMTVNDVCHRYPHGKCE